MRGRSGWAGRSFRELTDAAVLDLGVAEEGDGGLVRVTPELLLSEVERVEELDRRVALARKLG